MTAPLANALKTHFDPAKSSVDKSTRSEELITELFGRSISDQELIALCGSPVGSRLSLSFVPEMVHPPGHDDPDSKTEKTPAGMLVRVENAGYLWEPNEFIFYKSSPRTRAIYIKLVMFRPGKAPAIGGLMIKSILASLSQSRLTKFKSLDMMAAGGRLWGDMHLGGRWSGYCVWPKYGFDMPLHSATKNIIPRFEKFPKGLDRCETVSELRTLTGGPEFWEMVGDGYLMSFKLSLAKSKRQLESTLAEKYS